MTSESRSNTYAARLQALELRQVELEVQNYELLASNAELRSNNDALAVARDRYRSLYERAPIPLVTVDAQGSISDVNRAAEVVLQAPREHLIDRGLGVFVAEPSRATLSELLGELFRAGSVQQRGIALAPEADRPVDVCVDGAVLGDGADHAVLAVIDTTATKRAEDARREIDHRDEQARHLASLGGLAGGVAHGFNNLLTVVLGGTDYALRTVDAESSTAEALNDVRRAARRAADLAFQMLAYSGRIGTPILPLDLRKLVRHLESRIREVSLDTPVVFDLPDAPLWIGGDETQLQQVVLNVVTNAREAMRDRTGAVVVSVHAETGSDGAPGDDASRVVLEVRDHGVGMDAATKSRLFDPFFSTKFVGRGLGLAVVDGIVRGHGASITVESTVDVGTVVRVCFPSVASPHKTPRPARPRTGTFLVVDDDDSVLVTVARMLRKLGHVALTATDGARGVETFRAEQAHIDAILMDMTMPVMDGLAAAIAIREIKREIPIVLITGYAEISPQAARVFDALLAKPFDLDSMKHVLDQVMPAENRA